MNKTILHRQRGDQHKGTITGVPPSQSYNDYQTENQKLIAEMVKAVWDAGYKEGMKHGA